MLVKEVCKRCVNKAAQQKGSWLEWNAHDEDAWNEEYMVFCPDDEWTVVSVYTNVSELTHCPYQLEMILKRSQNAG
jgi:hypothetical protein